MKHPPSLILWGFITKWCDLNSDIFPIVIEEIFTKIKFDTKMKFEADINKKKNREKMALINFIN